MVNFEILDHPAPVASLESVRLSNGIALNYVRQGPNSGPALIMLHGFTDSWFSFSRVLPLLPPELRVVAPDLRGHGDSDRPLLGYRMGDFADDVVRLMDALEIPKAVIVGHSMGSFVARKVCEQAPERVSRLVLVGAGPSAANQSILELLREVNELSDPVDEAFVRAFQESTVHLPVPPSFMEAVIANSRRMPARIWKAALQGLVDNTFASRKSDIRTLVVGGRNDAIFSTTEQMVLARQYPRGELHLVEHVGHTLHWEQPATFVSALIRFGV